MAMCRWREAWMSKGWLGTQHRKFTILAVSSGGGHWEELMLLRPAFADINQVFGTTNAELAKRDHIDAFEFLPDANRDEPWRATTCLLAAFRLVWKVRPEVLITTGALPGLFCLVWGRLLGARTIWVDSIANSDQPSLSGRLARPFTHEWFTQWEHLAQDRRRYEGAVL